MGPPAHDGRRWKDEGDESPGGPGSPGDPDSHGGPFGLLRRQGRRIEPVEPGRYRIVGDLTIRDVTREAVLEATLGARGKSPISEPWEVSRCSETRG